ncbi:MAG: 4Fe-4S dicluster domain-containing protein [Rhodothermales bacterium]
MNFGFLIRNDRCIGCHACTTACKSENQVPLGVNRTWVKNIETGVYPDVRRHFQVTRCNHCANPPCVRICPVEAMYRRDDGIVEFDSDVCIGCKACLQACPYDAIYVDPDSGTAAKCHYCAHRIEVGLEPACVVVCPEHAIISGDMDDPLSEISRMLEDFEVTVRRPEQQTSPKLFYVEGEPANLAPSPSGGDGFAWADIVPGQQLVVDPPPITIEQGRMAEQMVRVFYNAQHKIPWHWPVPAYLVTKAIGAGVVMLLAFAYGFGLVAFDAATFAFTGLASIVFTGLTTALLVFDLERPERFFRILFRPQWKSWLARGAFILVGFTLVTGAWFILEAGAWLEMWNPIGDTLRRALLAVGFLLGGGTAAYTALLFGQAEGRDLWQSSLLSSHLLVQALMAGSALFLVALAFTDAAGGGLARAAFLIAAIADLALMYAELARPHQSDTAARAAKSIHKGRYRRFFLGSVILGHVLPILLLAAGAPVLTGVAGLLAIFGLYLYEYAFVMAPQEVPNS